MLCNIKRFDVLHQLVVFIYLLTFIRLVTCFLVSLGSILVGRLLGLLVHAVLSWARGQKALC